MAATTTSKTSTTKAKTTGVRKAGRPKGAGKRSNARIAMAKMQAFFKEHRPKYKELEFKDQQKKLGEDWKKSPKNPKNAA